MEKDSKIIFFDNERREEKARNVRESVQMEDLLSRLETKLESSVQNLELKRRIEREDIRKEIQTIADIFENRLQEALKDRDPKSKVEASFRLTGAQLQSNLGRIMKKIISVPDFDLMRRSEQVDEFGLDPDFEKQVMPFFEFLHNDYWRIETHGLHLIPNTGRGLIVANHSGTLPFDGAMIKVAIRRSHPARREVRFLVEDFVYHFPFLGMYMSRFGGVRACQENAERLLHNDHLVTVFPEGVKGIGKLYRHRYKLERFGRGGVIRLAIKTRTPIIPTAIIGAEEIYPLIAKLQFLARPLGIPFIPVTPFFPWFGPLGLLPLPSKWLITFGKPLDFSHLDPDQADDHLLISRVNEELRQTIQEMIKDGLSKRLNVWLG